MDYLFLFLLSGGAVGGVFKGLKKSVKELLIFVITYMLFAFLFSPVANFVESKNVCKSEVCEFVQSNFCGNKIFEEQIWSEETLSEKIESSDLNYLLKEYSIFAIKNQSKEQTLGGAVQEYTYKLLVFFVVAVLLFLLIFFVVSKLVKFLCVNGKKEKTLFVTKRVLAGGVGMAKGLVLFFGVVIVCLSVVEILPVDFLSKTLESSSFSASIAAAVSPQVKEYLLSLFL